MESHITPNAFAENDVDRIEYKIIDISQYIILNNHGAIYTWIDPFTLYDDTDLYNTRVGSVVVGNKGETVIMVPREIHTADIRRLLRVYSKTLFIRR
jgi:hypothetical protein